MDLWRPKPVVSVNKMRYEFHIMTMVDPITGWFKQRQLYCPHNAYVCQQIQDSAWLSRYLYPKEISTNPLLSFKRHITGTYQ